MIVAIAGKLRSGKDVTASLIKARLTTIYPHVINLVQRIALADSLKDECADIYNLDINRIKYEYAYKSLHRQKLIDYGAIKRKEDPEYWIKRVMDNISCHVVLVPDVRYKNELAFFKEHSEQSISIRVECNDRARMEHGWVPSSADLTVSECDLDDHNDWDFVLHNNGTLAELSDSINPIINSIVNYLSPLFGKPAVQNQLQYVRQ